MNTIRKAQLLQKRKWRIRKKVTGTAERPRLCVHFSGKHIYAQAIDDVKGATLVAVSTLTPDLRAQKLAANGSSAKGSEDSFNPLDPLGLFGKSGPLAALSPAAILGGEGGPPLPPGLKELLSAARPEAASLVGGFPV